jgi:hypothetical protein
MNADLTKTADGITAKSLHQDSRETVRSISMEPGAILSEMPVGGAEILILDGSAQESDDTLQKGAWLRLPQGTSLNITAGSSGAKLWIKTGHLPFAAAPPL